MTKISFTGKGYRAKEPLELIHSDLYGLVNAKARGGFEYFISIIDDYSSRDYRHGSFNDVPLKSVFETPFELWRGRKPSLSHFKIWGCPAHVLVTNPKKLEPRSRLCQFVGYPKEMRGGLFFDP
ncbi:gag/pol protein [Cucumis melo var. makuwa]|uniref:Gag/pol protein n=1 Tax=Cucumis melo var. makuwa TaxID=1194695 RepID=A0A5A7UW25_CUCMM|nr:gag/pol protein [Cucumis melo var. makuwa]TYK23413.1 gag/pol protein [Cucumis melo var. makuwa]